MIEDAIDLHRMVWSPDDFDGDKLKTSAFRKEDLKGGQSDFVSVSRTDTLTAAAELSLAEQQSHKADGARFKRTSAWSALLNCGTVRASTDVEGAHPFNVTPEPLAANEAHCGIRNVSGKAGKGYINQLRILLVEVVHETNRLDDFLRKISEGGS